MTKTINPTGKKFVAAILTAVFVSLAGFVQAQGDPVCPQFYNGLAPFMMDGKWGFIDKNGNLVIEPVYDAVSNFDFPDGTAIAYVFEGKTAVDESYEWPETYIAISKATCFNIDRAGKRIGKAVFPIAEGKTIDSREMLRASAEKWSFLKEKDKRCLTNKIGKGIVNPDCYDIFFYKGDDYGFFFHDGLALQVTDNLLHVIDTTFQIVATPACQFVEYVNDFHDGLALVRECVMHGNYSRQASQKGWYIDHTGKKAAIPSFDESSDFSDGMAAVKVNGKWGFINTEGEMVIEPRFDGLIKPRLDGCIGYGVAKHETDSATLVKYFSEGLAAYRDENGKWGYIDKKGKTVIVPQYTDAFPFSDGLAFVGFPNGYLPIPRIDELGDIFDERRKPLSMYGCIDKEGNLVIPPKYEWDKLEPELSSFQDGIALVSTLRHNVDPFSSGDGSLDYGYIDKTGKRVKDPIFTDAGDFSEGLAWVSQNNVFGFINSDGDIAIAPDFERALPFSDGLAAVKKNGRWGFIDKAGNVVIPPKYDDAQPFFDGLAAFSDGNGKWGYINKAGNVAIPPKYDEARPFFEGMAVVRTSKEWAVINKLGETVFSKPSNYNIEDYSEGWAAFSDENGKWGYLDKAGNVVIPPQYDYPPAPFFEGLACVRKSKKWTVINKDGQTVFTAKESVGPYSEGLAGFLSPNGKYGYLDKRGDTAIAPMFDKAYPFHEGLAKVKMDGLDGYIDKTGKMVVEPQFFFSRDFSNGLAVYAQGEEAEDWFVYLVSDLDLDSDIDEYIVISGYFELRKHEDLYYNKQGRIAFTLPYDTVYPFSDGLAAVSVNGKWGFINTKGEMVIAPQFDEESFVSFCSDLLGYSEGLCLIKNSDNKYGYMDKTGKIVIKCQYEDAGDFHDGLAKVKVNGKYGFIDKTGKMVIEPRFY